jgi:hypothetical protein
LPCRYRLPEPRRIAAYLDASGAAIDAAVAAKRHQLETLDDQNHFYQTEDNRRDLQCGRNAHD